MKKSTAKVIDNLTKDLFETKKETTIMKVHRGCKISFLSIDRVMIETTDDTISDYLKDNEVYVETEFGNKTRMGQAGYNKKGRKNPKHDQTIVSVSRIPNFWRQLIRVIDQLNGDRTTDSLATEAQLARVKQFFTILNYRPSNTLLPPVEIDQYTHGEIGRLRSDLEAILVKEGLWDLETKTETVKAKELKKKRNK